MTTPKLDSFSWEVYEFLQKKNLLNSGDSCLISISGGCDSVALSVLFSNFLRKIDLKLELVHFHHNIRQESDKEADFVLKLAKKLNLPCHLFKAEKINAPAVQKKARDWRYQKLQQLRAEKNFKFVVLGHQLNDLVETQIWRLVRGASLFDLATMLPYEKFYLRPLLYTPKKKIQDYLNSIQQNWVEDESNQKDTYTRNVIRMHLIPKMQKISSSEIGETSQKFLEKMLALHKEAIELKEIYQQKIQPIDITKNYLTFEEIKTLPSLFAQRLIHDFLIQQEIEFVLRAQIENIYNLVSQNKGNWEVKLTESKVVKGRNKKIFLN